MNTFLDFFRTIGVSRLAAMGAVAVTMIGFFIYLMVKLSQPQMGILFTDLPFEDSLEVVKKLEGTNIPHEIRQDGAVVLVPKNKVLRLRMELAEDGIPTGGSVGYEIFDKSDSLGATSFVQNINHLRAIEGELARTIRSLDNVQLARVHLVLPQKKLFSRKNTAPSASIVVKIRGSLGSGQIKAIQHLVASAVEELNPDRVSIVDERGKLLASGNGDMVGATAVGSDERNRAYENRITQQIEEIVSSIVGPGHVRVTVNAELDYSRITKQSEIYDPDGQVVRSNQVSQEKSSSNLPANDGSVSVGNELPSTSNESNSAGSQTEDANKTEETTNYEISRTTQTETIEAGRIKRVSVAVLVDGSYLKGTDGKLQYQPRTAKELEQITQLVRSSIGFNQERGDQIHVSNLRFAQNEVGFDDKPEQASILGFSKDDYFYLAELIVTLIVSLLVLLFVVRPLVRRIITPEEITDDAQLLTADSITQSGSPQIAGNTSETLALENNSSSEETPQSGAVLALQQAKLSGEVHHAAIKEIGELIQNHPQEATSVVQNWINETSVTA